MWFVHEMQQFLSMNFMINCLIMKALWRLMILNWLVLPSSNKTRDLLILVDVLVVKMNTKTTHEISTAITHTTQDHLLIPLHFLDMVLPLNKVGMHTMLLTSHGWSFNYVFDWEIVQGTNNLVFYPLALKLK